MANKIPEKNYVTQIYERFIFSIDNAARQLKIQAERVQIFCYLEQHLPCTKQTIFNHIKKYKTDQEDAKVKHIEHKLKNIVEPMMPDMAEEHRLRCQNLRDEFEKRKTIGEKDTKFRSPRRKFKWTDEIR